jgi:hypothetical protein
MVKIFDEEVIFKETISVPDITMIGGGGGDLSVVDDINVVGDAVIGGNLTVSGNISMTTATSITLDASSTISLAGLYVELGFDTESAEITVGGVSASSLTLDAATVDIGANTGVAAVISLGHASADTINVLAATAINVEANAVAVGHTTACTQLDLGVAGVAVGLHGDTIGINGATAVNINAPTIGFVSATTVNVDGAYVNIGTSTSYSNYITLGAVDGGKVQIARQYVKSVTGAAVTVSAADLGALVVHDGAEAGTVTLPAALAGLRVAVTKTGASAITLSAASGDYFVGSDGSTAESFALTLGVVQDVVGVDGARWYTNTSGLGA